MRACTCCTGNGGGAATSVHSSTDSWELRLLCINILRWWHPLKNVEADWVRCLLVKIRCGPVFPTLSLPEEIDLLSLSGSYESAASRGVLLPFTGAACWQAHDDSWAGPRCVYVRTRPQRAHESARVCALPRPEDRNLSMAAEIVGIPEIPPDSKQPVTRQEGERPMREGLSARVIHSATGTGAMFHKIKAPLFEEHAALQPRCTGNIKRQHRRAASGRPCAKITSKTLTPLVEMLLFCSTFLKINVRKGFLL